MAQRQRLPGYRYTSQVLVLLGVAVLLLTQEFGPLGRLAGGVVGLILGAAAMVVQSRDRDTGRPEPPAPGGLRVTAFLQAGVGLIFVFLAVRRGALDEWALALLYTVLAAVSLIAALVSYRRSRRAQRAR